jgi:hypothetical protein
LTFNAVGWGHCMKRYFVAEAMLSSTSRTKPEIWSKWKWTHSKFMTRQGLRK